MLAIALLWLKCDVDPHRKTQELNASLQIHELNVPELFHAVPRKLLVETSRCRGCERSGVDITERHFAQRITEAMREHCLISDALCPPRRMLQRVLTPCLLQAQLSHADWWR